jgi:hypothetical protein
MKATSEKRKTMAAHRTCCLPSVTLGPAAVSNFTSQHCVEGTIVELSLLSDLAS